MPRKDVVVLGAGVSGLTIADGLLDQGNGVTILDAYREPGGNHRSWEIGPYSYDIGTIFFPEHSPVRELLPDITHQWVRAEHTVERITPSGQVRAYPLSLKDEVVLRSPLYIATVGFQIIAQKLRLKPPSSVAAFVRYYIGDRLLQDSGLLLFMQRFYNLPIDQVGFALAKRRMAWIGDHAGLRVQGRKALRKLGRILRGQPGAAPDQWYAKNWYVRPRAGFAAMYRPAVARLQAKGAHVELGTAPLRIERTEPGFRVITADRTFACDRLVSTIPLEIVAPLLGLAADTGPRSSPLMTLCLRFRGERHFAAEVLYNFHRDGAWKRLTMHSDFYGKADGWEYLAVEVAMPSEQVDAAALFAEFRAMTTGVGLFIGRLEMVGHHVTHFAYPIYDLQAETRRDQALASLHALGVETVGRQGNFEYVPVLTEAMASARDHVAGTA